MQRKLCQLWNKVKLLFSRSRLSILPLFALSVKKVFHVFSICSVNRSIGPVCPYNYKNVFMSKHNIQPDKTGVARHSTVQRNVSTIDESTQWEMQCSITRWQDTVQLSGLVSDSCNHCQPVDSWYTDCSYSWCQTYDGMLRRHHMFDLVTWDIKILCHVDFTVHIHGVKHMMSLVHDMTRWLHHQTYLYRMLKIFLFSRYTIFCKMESNILLKPTL